ncbi:unnamed protein product [Vitrella brassicaformis CCMP3155]|uniref:Uncharacterized protein n=1 Tax=Vitrella brassicaformis (strain CCMP3155) TaxID=1169540 RepID=A0A0G4EYT6_VITBC|nr:unnamed protein product [Vitrella brassicaformis CCMP3155]|eukprot:CEM04106.1 unnamed protein product [Vitrella brassicaformis CCMP3155]
MSNTSESNGMRTIVALIRKLQLDCEVYQHLTEDLRSLLDRLLESASAACEEQQTSATTDEQEGLKEPSALEMMLVITFARPESTRYQTCKEYLGDAFESVRMQARQQLESICNERPTDSACRCAKNK